MARVELIIPKMGESVSEATVISWNKEVGEMVEIDDTIIEIATDKVDSEVPSTHEGKLLEKLFDTDDIVKVGEPFAILEIEGENTESDNTKNQSQNNSNITTTKEEAKTVSIDTVKTNTITENPTNNIKNTGERFYSPLVKSMAIQEGITIKELDLITGTGKENRVTKQDMLSYINSRNIDANQLKQEEKNQKIQEEIPQKSTDIASPQKNISNTITATGDTEIIEMDRMRKLISTHMTMSKQTSAHITSFVEADMTNIVNWRNKVKEEFKKREGQNI